MPMTLPYAWITLEINLCAEGNATLLETVDGPTPHEVIEYVLGTYGIPDAVLRQAHSRDAVEPTGWIVPAPASLTTAPRRSETVFGAVEVPGAHIEIIPTSTEIGMTQMPYLPTWLTVPEYRAAFADAGLLDGAGRQLHHLWDTYSAAWGRHGTDPYGAMEDLLSVVRRARDAGAMTLAAHAADHEGSLLSACGDHDVAVWLHRWAIGQYRRSNEDRDLAMALNNLGHALWHQGKQAAAVAAYAEAETFATYAHEGKEVRRAIVDSVEPMVAAGRAEDAIRRLEVIGPRRRRGPDVWWTFAYALSLIAVGRIDEAEASIQECALRLDEPDGYLHDLLARIAVTRGDEATAAAHRTMHAETLVVIPAPFTH
jgi:hypothetical protein